MSDNKTVPSYKDNRKGKTFFKKPDSNNVENRILLGLMIVEGITVKKLAKQVNLSTRSIQRYIYEGDLPGEDNQDKIAAALDCDKHTLFKEVR